MKKRNWLNVAAIVLSTIMFLQSMPDKLLFALAEGVSNLVGTEENVVNETDITEPLKKNLTDVNNRDGGYIIKEDESKRTARTKEFIMSDNTILVQQFAEDVHFYEDEKYKEIDNSLVEDIAEDGRTIYKNNANSFKVKFDKTAKKGTDFIEIEEDGYKLKFKYKGQKGDCVQPTFNNKGKSEKFQYDDKKLTKPVDHVMATGRVEYENIEDGIDIIYEMQGKGLKENIVVETPQEKYAYTFELSSNNLYFSDNEEGSIHISDDKGEIKFVIPAPFMVDANGKYSDAVKYTLNSSKRGRAELTIIADSDWINSEATFPIMIDPIIQSYTQTDFSFVNVFSDGKKITTGNEVYAGKKNGSTKGDVFLCYDVVRRSNCMLIDASIDFTYSTQNVGFWDLTDKVVCDVFVAGYDVAFSSITYTNQPAQLQYLSTIEHTTNRDNVSFSKFVNVSNIKYDKLLIGIKTLSNTTNGEYITINTSSNASSVTLRYKYMSGLDDDYSVETFELGNATAYVNNDSGFLTVNCDLASVNTMSSIPLVASLVYNTNYDSLLSELGELNRFGNNFKLNFQQYVRKIDSTTYQLIDSDGSITTFHKEITGGELYTDFSHNLTMGVDGRAAYIADVQGNRMYFEDNLLKIIIPQGEDLTVSKAIINGIEIRRYQENGLNTDKILGIDYYENSFITYRMEFSYSGDVVSGVTTYIGTSNEQLMEYALTYDDAGNLVSIRNISAGINELEMDYEGADGMQLKSIFNYQQNGLFFTNYLYSYQIWKVHSMKGSLTDDYQSTWVYDYVEFDYDKSTVIKYYKDNNVSATKHICFNNARNIVSEWVEDGDGKISISNMGNWQSIANKNNYEDYIQENYVYTEKQNTSITSEQLLETGEVISGVLRHTDIPNNDTYYKYALSFKLQSKWDLDITVSMAGETQDVVLVNGGELYVSIPCNYRAYGTGFTIKNNSSIYEVTVSNISYEVVEYTKIVRTVPDGKARYVLGEIIRQGVDGNYVKYVYDKGQKLTRIEECSLDYPSLKKVEYAYNDSDILETVTAIGNEGSVLSKTEYAYETSSDRTVSTNTVKKTAGEYQTQNVTITTKTTNLITVEQKSEYGLTQKSYYTPHNGDIRLTKTESGDYSEEYTYNFLGQLTSVKSISTDNTVILEQTNSYEQGVYIGSIYNQNTYSVSNDGKGLLTGITYTAGNESTTMIAYTYNEPNGARDNGDLVAKTYANGNVEDYTHSADKLIINHKNSATDNKTQATYQYCFDGNGRIKQMMTDCTGDSSVSYNYSDWDNEDEQIFTINGLEYYTQYKNIYDASGRLTGGMLNSLKSCGTTEFFVLDYEYNEYGQMISEKFGSHEAEYEYDTLGRLSTYTTNVQEKKYVYEKGTEEGIAYTVKIEDLINGIIGTATGSYDENGYLTKVSYGGSSSNSWGYVYDGVGRLKEEKRGNVVYTAYEYDTTNNIKRKSSLGVVTDYEYDAKNRLIKAGEDLFYYDAMGNPIKYKVSAAESAQNLFWTQGRKLSSGTLNGKNFAYRYDGNGMRYKKVVNGVTTEYYYNGTQLLIENRNGNRTYYIYDATGIAGMVYDGRYYYFDKNVLGDVMAIRDHSGNVVATYKYDAWGNIMDQSGSMANVNPFRYRGYYYDVETGFYYLQTRYYDPEIMRFINADDYELVASLSAVPGQLNMYAYCNNNPVMFTDPTGEIAWLSLAIGAVIGAAFGGISAYISGGNIWAGIIIGAATGALSAILPQNVWISSGLAFCNSLANNIYNDKGFQTEHFEEAIMSAAIAGGLFNVKIEALNLIGDKILTEISDGIIQNTLGVFSENILAYLTIQTSVSMVACWYTNTEIKQFYVVQYRGV